MKKLLLAMLLMSACTINIMNALTCEDIDGMYAQTIHNFRKTKNNFERSPSVPAFMELRESYDAWLMLQIMHGECHEQSKDNQDKIRDMRARMKSFRQLEKELQENCNQAADNADTLINELEENFKKSVQQEK